MDETSTDLSGDPPDGDRDGAGDGDGDGDGAPQHHRAIGVATGELHSCALLEDHAVKCWGNNGYGQLGYGDTLERGSTQEQMGDALPVVDLGSGRTAVKIAAGHYATCAILDDRSLKCWGMAGVNGVPQQQIGDQPGEMGANLAPLDFGGRRVSDAVIGHGVACALMEDDTIWCWGPTTTAPKMVAGLSSDPVQALAAAGASIFALYADGTVSPALPNGTAPVFGGKVVTVSGAYGGPTCVVFPWRQDRKRGGNWVDWRASVVA